MKLILPSLLLLSVRMILSSTHYIHCQTLPLNNKGQAPVYTAAKRA